MKFAALALALSPFFVAFTACGTPSASTTPTSPLPDPRSPVKQRVAAPAYDPLSRVVELSDAAERAERRGDRADARSKSVEAINILLQPGARYESDSRMSALYALARIADNTGDKSAAGRAWDRVLALRDLGYRFDEDAWRRSVGPDGKAVVPEEAKSKVSERKQPDDATELRERGTAPGGVDATSTATKPGGADAALNANDPIDTNGRGSDGSRTSPRGSDPDAGRSGTGGADAQQPDATKPGGDGQAHPSGAGAGRAPRTVSVTYRIDFILRLTIAWTLYLRLEYTEAGNAFEQLFDEGSHSLPEGDVLLAEAREGVAGVQEIRGDLDGSRMGWDWIVAYRSRWQGADHHDTRAARKYRGNMRGSNGDGPRSAPVPPGADEARRGPVATRESASDKARRAAEMLRKCEPARALTLQREVVDELSRAADVDERELEEARRQLVTVLRVLGKTDEARMLEEELFLTRLREQAARAAGTH